MSRSAMIRARIDPKLKTQAEHIIKSLGLNASSVISLFYSQIKFQQGIPFEVRIPEKIKGSKVRDASIKALVKKCRAMTPDERLQAFFNHSYLVRQMNESGVRRRKKKKEGS